MTSRQPGPFILIVDDEPEIRSFMSDALDVFGYQVGAARMPMRPSPSSPAPGSIS